MTEFLTANMAPIMFVSLIVFLMFGYAVTFSLAACGLFFGFVAIELGMIQPAFLQSLPLRMFTDNGNPWGDSQGNRWTTFRVWLLQLGVELIHSRPYHPQSRGKNERFHRSLEAEVMSLRPLTTMADAQKAFDRWRHIYNHQRPHEALDLAVPASRYRPSIRPMPRKPAEPLYADGTITRKVPAT